MRILHVIPTFAPAWRYGGPVRAAYEMTRRLAMRGHEISVITTNRDVDGTLDVPTSETIDMEGVRVSYFPLSFPKAYFYSSEMNAALKREIPRHDLVHIHSMHYWPTSAAAWYSRMFGIPYIMRPAGSLDPICIEKRYEGAVKSCKSRLKKWFYWNMIGRREFNGAEGIHFTSEGEMAASAPLIDGPLECIVPLGVEKPKTLAPRGAPVSGAFAEAKGRPILLFLSRIDAKKGCGLLIQALSLLRSQGKEIFLIMAGGGDVEQERCLDEEIARGGLRDCVLRLGPVEGDARWHLFESARMMILPSFHENFGIAVVEALACGTPVVISDRINIKDIVEKSGAGLICTLDAGDIARKIDCLLADDVLRREMSEKALQCYEANFTWDRSIAALEGMYEAISKRTTVRATV